MQGTLPEDYLPGLGPLLKAAVERSPNTITASINLAMSEGGRYQDAAALWPSLNFNGDYQQSSTAESNAASSTNRGFFYTASLSQPIFQWGAYKNNAAIGRLGVKIAERNYAEAYRGLAVSIREQYMGLIQKKVLLRNAQFNLKLQQESLSAQQVKFQAGSASQADLLAFQLSNQQAQLDADRSAEDFGYAKRVFLRLLGIDEISDESIPQEIPHPEYSAPLTDAVLAGFVGNGIESTFQSQVYRMMIQQQDLNYSVQKVRLLPKINALVAYELFNQTQIFGGRVTQTALQQENYQVQAVWTIFDGFAARGAKMQALASKRLQERLMKNYVDSTIDQVTDMHHQIGFASRALSLAEVHHDLIAAEVKRLGGDRTLGFASQASIDSGVLNLYATEFQVVNARADYLGRWTEFISLAGADPALANLSPRYVR